MTQAKTARELKHLIKLELDLQSVEHKPLPGPKSPLIDTNHLNMSDLCIIPLEINENVKKHPVLKCFLDLALYLDLHQKLTGSILGRDP